MTLGSVSINENAQVLDTQGNVIPGLYAAGKEGKIEAVVIVKQHESGFTSGAQVTVMAQIVETNALKVVYLLACSKQFLTASAICVVVRVAPVTTYL